MRKKRSNVRKMGAFIEASNWGQVPDPVGGKLIRGCRYIYIYIFSFTVFQWGRNPLFVG
jgi:hypothetical protein